MGILSSLFGGGTKKQTTSNAAYGQLSGAFSPLLPYAGQAGSAISSFLGGDPTGFNNYKSETGFNTALGQGLQGVTGAEAAKGLLRSGAAGKAFENFGQGLEQQSAGNYLQQLLGLGGLGLQAGQVISGAAPQTTTQKSGGGLGAILGGALSFLSDPRLKTRVEKIGEAADGLGIYRFRYRGHPKLHTGVMATEVARLRPWALGRRWGTYMSVRYDLLEAA